MGWIEGGRTKAPRVSVDFARTVRRLGEHGEDDILHYDSVRFKKHVFKLLRRTEFFVVVHEHRTWSVVKSCLRTIIIHRSIRDWCRSFDDLRSYRTATCLYNYEVSSRRFGILHGLSALGPAREIIKKKKAYVSYSRHLVGLFWSCIRTTIELYLRNTQKLTSEYVCVLQVRSTRTLNVNVLSSTRVLWTGCVFDQFDLATQYPFIISPEKLFFFLGGGHRNERYTTWKTVSFGGGPVTFLPIHTDENYYFSHVLHSQRPEGGG